MTRTTNQNSNISQALEQIDPEDFIEHLGADYRTTTGRSGTQLNIKECPRCGGRDWKVFLNAETGLGTCFHGSCVGEPGFNLYTFARHLLGDNKDASQTILQFAKDLGWRPVREKRTAPVSVGVNHTGVALPDSVLLPIKGRTLKWLAERGFGPEIAAEYGWRYSKTGYYGYTGHDGNPRKQDYSNRVILPIYDINGQLQTFQGRYLGAHSEKYIFPPGLPGTGRFLYNAHRALGKTELVMGEGVFDVAAIEQALVTDKTLDVGVVGTFGKTFSGGEGGFDDQLTTLMLLKSGGLQRITLMWDGELTTQIAAFETAMSLRRYGFAMRVALLPRDKDPNEVPPAAVRKAYHEALDATRMNQVRFVTSAR